MSLVHSLTLLNEQYKVYIPAVLINLDALYMIDNTLDSLDFTDWIWGFQLNLSSIIIPKNWVAATRVTQHC